MSELTSISLSEPGSERTLAPSNPVTPAPYGQACAGCARAKCKCFYRSAGLECERCYRLGKSCEPSARMRKRRARTQAHPPPPSVRMEEKLDHLVLLMRPQAAEKQIQTQVPSMSANSDPSSTMKASTIIGDSISSTPVRDTELVINTNTSVVHYLRSTAPETTPLSIVDDIAVCDISAETAEVSLNTFRRDFIPIFPFAHLSASLSATELRCRKPFLWLIIMALTATQVSQQFAMEEVIWHIISRRVVAQQLADLDLLLGMVCFASWSHYFKKDKPFMGMLCHLAVSLAFELGLQKDTPPSMPRPRNSGQLRAQRPPLLQTRTMEERRAILAVFHLSSSSWTAFRKTEPLRWTPYMDGCLRILSEGTETHFDIILATQLKCQMITNQLTCSQMDEPVDGEILSAPPAVLTTALLRQIGDIRQTLPAQIRLERVIQFYLHSTELTIQESVLKIPQRHDQTGLTHYRRLQDLNSILKSTERWFELFFEMPLTSWAAVSVDIFAQFTHSLVVLFTLTKLDEPGWDIDEVRARADVLSILDRSCEMIERVPAAVGMVDASGPRRGLFFKTTYLFRAIKTLFLTELMPSLPADELNQPHISSSHYAGTEDDTEAAMIDAYLMNLGEEPWLSDILGPLWDCGPESLVDVPFDT